MAFLRNLTSEFLIVIRYSVFPTVISLLLAFIDWHYGILLSFVKLVIFLRIVHNEDQRTGSMQFKYVFVKLITAVALYYLAEYAAMYLENNFLPYGIYPTSPIPEGASKAKIKVPKSRAKRILEMQRNDGWQTKVLNGVVRILVHYLYMANSVAQYRWSFLALVLIIFGLIHLVVAYYLPSKSKKSSNTVNHPDDGSSSSEDEDYGDDDETDTDA